MVALFPRRVAFKVSKVVVTRCKYQVLWMVLPRIEWMMVYL